MSAPVRIASAILSEPTPIGEQRLVPGVVPITMRDRLEARLVEDTLGRMGERGVNLAINTLPDDAAALKAIRASLRGTLIAWNPVKQKEAWRVDLGGPGNGGVLTSAGGLVFAGNAKGRLVAYAAERQGTVGVRCRDRHYRAAHHLCGGRRSICRGHGRLRRFLWNRCLVRRA